VVVLNSLDLFSGIGGLALSLEPIFQTVLYCEINSAAKQVLTSNMNKGFIHTAPAWSVPTMQAPIHSDVLLLNLFEINYLTGNKKIDLVCGGFPCTGFSSAGLLQGFKNKASFLFFEMRRIIEEVNPKFIFLENVPGVKKQLNEIVDSLGKLDYTLVWVTVNAKKAAGVPMLRRRWFLFGYKNSLLLNDVEQLKSLIMPPPSSVLFRRSSKQINYVEKFDRTISPDICSLKQSKQQISLIGNAVCVPQVQMVWNELIHRSCVNFDSVSIGKQTSKTDLANGYWDQSNNFVNMPVFKPNIIRPICSLKLDPNSCPLPFRKSPNQRLPVLTSPLLQTRFMTPVYTQKGAACVLTKRTAPAWSVPTMQAHDHPTQIRFEVNTINRFDPLNPSFYEALFGFPETFSSVF
jgi:site-specific DNA-cytosine methylase